MSVKINIQTIWLKTLLKTNKINKSIMNSLQQNQFNY